MSRELGAQTRIRNSTLRAILLVTRLRIFILFHASPSILCNAVAARVLTPPGAVTQLTHSDHRQGKKLPFTFCVDWIRDQTAAIPYQPVTMSLPQDPGRVFEARDKPARAKCPAPHAEFGVIGFWRPNPRFSIVGK